MVTPEEIGYENEIQENIGIEDLRKQYDDGIIIWLSGSGTSPAGKAGSYKCVLEYKGHTMFLEKELPGATANQTMIKGAIDAVSHVTKSVRLYLIAPTALGFLTGFKGKGPNCELMQTLYQLIKEKDCQLTEVQFINGGEAIKNYVYACNPDKAKIGEYKKQQEEKRNQYKESIYRECLAKVVSVLEANGVNAEIVEEIRKIK